MPEVIRALLPYGFLMLIALAITAWVGPTTDSGYQAFFVISFAALSCAWLILRAINARWR